MKCLPGRTQPYEFAENEEQTFSQGSPPNGKASYVNIGRTHPYEFAENEELIFSLHSPPHLEEAVVMMNFHLRNSLRQLGYSTSERGVMSPIRLDLVLRHKNGN